MLLFSFSIFSDRQVNESSGFEPFKFYHLRRFFRKCVDDKKPEKIFSLRFSPVPLCMEFT